MGGERRPDRAEPGVDEEDGRHFRPRRGRGVAPREVPEVRTARQRRVGPLPHPFGLRGRRELAAEFAVGPRGVGPRCGGHHFRRRGVEVGRLLLRTGGQDEGMRVRHGPLRDPAGADLGVRRQRQRRVDVPLPRRPRRRGGELPARARRGPSKGRRGRSRRCRGRAAGPGFQDGGQVRSLVRHTARVFCDRRSVGPVLAVKPEWGAEAGFHALIRVRA
mmetsp:Transcript_11070/g.22436  ORF Transcript_11070/g.22436 Transcript_11070/m.22436 type:complete len:218 (+) Transcript_11070:465-1118(+)